MNQSTSPPMDNLFHSTAEYYAKYRPAYPAAVFEFVVKQFGLNGHGQLLDVGCGTGQVCIPMSHWFQSVVAIDPDPDMVRLCREQAAELAIKNLDVRNMRAEEIDRSMGEFRLVTFGASFHWTDRDHVAALAHDVIEPGGGLVVIAPSSTWSGEERPWKTAVRGVLKQWLGEQRRAGSGTFQPGENAEQVLARHGFSDIQVRNSYQEHVWSVDSLLGYLYSTSFASKAVLAEKADGFERDMIRALLACDGLGRYTERLEITVVSAWK